ncbi:MAG: outer membrane protein [Xanthobacteraceae bacterium]
MSARPAVAIEDAEETPKIPPGGKLNNVTLKLVAALAASLALPGATVANELLRTQTGTASASSWLAGAVAGYNWQQGSLVYGIESDLSGTNLKSEVVSGFGNLPVNFVSPTFDTTANVDWYGTVRGRLGWAAGSFLFYGTGGLAYGKVDLGTSFNPGSFTFPNAASLNGQVSSVRVGWVVGAGVDYMWTPNLILKLQYQYVDLGSVNLVTSGGALSQITSSASAHAQFQAVTLGAVWQFAPPETVVASRQKPRHTPPAIVSNPWEGLYVGGRAGGAWGNGLTVTSSARPAG